MAIIPSFFMDAVVALGIDIGENTKHWVGTGFLVGRKERDNSGRCTVYIITNKHVVKNQKLLYVRFNNSGSIGVKDLQMPLENLNLYNYSEHPNSLVDIVAIQILPQVILDNQLSLSVQNTPSNTSVNLIGILSAYIPYRDTLVSRQTGQPVMIREENSGLTIVHPVDRIKEVVEMEWRRNEQIRLAQQPQQTQALRQPEGATV